MTSSDLLITLLLGGLLGMMGQGIRVIIGLKKINDNAQRNNTDPKEDFDPKTLIISLFIGFVSGGLTVLTLSPLAPCSANAASICPSSENIMALLAAGYAGTDVIEAFMNKYLPSSPNTMPRPLAEPDNGTDQTPPRAYG